MPGRTKIAIALVAAGLTAGVLTACSGAAATLEQALIEQAQGDGDQFSLAGQEGQFGQWDQVVIMCPYQYEPENLEPRFAKAIGSAEEFLDESSQWLIFAKADETAKMLRLDRDEVDFCFHEVSTDPIDIDQRWSAEQDEGRWLIRPVD